MQQRLHTSRKQKVQASGKGSHKTKRGSYNVTWTFLFQHLIFHLHIKNIK